MPSNNKYREIIADLKKKNRDEQTEIKELKGEVEKLEKIFEREKIMSVNCMRQVIIYEMMMTKHKGWFERFTSESWNEDDKERMDELRIFVFEQIIDDFERKYVDGLVERMKK